MTVVQANKYDKFDYNKQRIVLFQNKNKENISLFVHMIIIQYYLFGMKFG